MRWIVILLMSLSVSSRAAVPVKYTAADSLIAVKLLEGANEHSESMSGKPLTTSGWMVYFARKLCGTKSWAKTLDGNGSECLVVNLRQMDCTTFVENVLAFALCLKSAKTGFADFCYFLRQVRYRGGNVSYADRLHYFSDWVEDNSAKGFVANTGEGDSVFVAKRLPVINYMSTHASKYPQLAKNPKLIRHIRERERKLSGMTYYYIPKRNLDNSAAYRAAISDGDIVVITTSKPGLDTAHIGIAVWHDDGLHLLNCSQIHKKVVEEPLTMPVYMARHPTQTGVRIVRVL